MMAITMQIVLMCQPSDMVEWLIAYELVVMHPKFIFPLPIEMNWHTLLLHNV